MGLIEAISSVSSERCDSDGRTHVLHQSHFGGVHDHGEPRTITDEISWASIFVKHPSSTNALHLCWHGWKPKTSVRLSTKAITVMPTCHEYWQTNIFSGVKGAVSAKPCTSQRFSCALPHPHRTALETRVSLRWSISLRRLRLVDTTATPINDWYIVYRSSNL